MMRFLSAGRRPQPYLGETDFHSFPVMFCAVSQAIRVFQAVSEGPRAAATSSSEGGVFLPIKAFGISTLAFFWILPRADCRARQGSIEISLDAAGLFHVEQRRIHRPSQGVPRGTRSGALADTKVAHPGRSTWNREGSLQSSFRRRHEIGTHTEMSENHASYWLKFSTT